MSTEYISPQFHLVFDDLFDTVIHTRDEYSVFNTIFNDMFDLNRDCYAKDENDDNDKLIYRPPLLEEVCLNEQGCHNPGH